MKCNVMYCNEMYVFMYVMYVMYVMYAMNVCNVMYCNVMEWTVM